MRAIKTPLLRSSRLLFAIGLLVLGGGTAWWLNKSADLEGYRIPAPATLRENRESTTDVALWEPTNGVVRSIVGPVSGLPTETPEQFQNLLLAELSDRPRFALVERGELNRILAEAELSLGNLGDPANAVRAGRLLNADRLLLMKRVPLSSGRGLLLARIVDTRSGVIRDITAFDKDSADCRRCA